MADDEKMRAAWFSPLPPTRSGIAAYSADVIPALGSEHAIDCYVDRPSAPVHGARLFDAHDFVWRHRRAPYDLIVYQLGNAPCHDYLWAYLATYPGLVVLHDAGVHHARARHLLDQKRFDDYRAEFRYDHPDAAADFTEYAVEGLGGSIYYLWSMLGVVLRTARAIAVHNARVASDLSAEFPDIAIDTIRMGVPSIEPDAATSAALRRALQLPPHAFVFAAFGKVTAEKRISSILRALAALAAQGVDAFLLLLGDADGCASLADDVARLEIGARVRVAGYVPDEAIGAYLSAADAALCLRWPTAHETSASWLRCLAASRPTIVTDLAQLIDVPTIDPRAWEPSSPGATPVAIAIDLLDEDRSLETAMGRLASDRALGDRLGRAGHAYWSARHSVEGMVSDYSRVMKSAAERPAPVIRDLPAHFTNDGAGRARRIARTFGVEVDVLDRGVVIKNP
jgi:glycosyltransferase involved in cell wall biosynthesis